MKPEAEALHYLIVPVLVIYGRARPPFRYCQRLVA